VVRVVRLLSEDGSARLRDGLDRAFRSRRARLVTILGAAGYAVLYLLLARALVVAPEAHFSRFAQIPSLVLAPALSWRSLIDPFNPPAILYLADGIAFGPTVPILAASIVLGALFGANLALAVETLALGVTRCAAPAVGLAAALPGFLAAFSCCAPTVLLVLGGNFAVAVVALAPFAVPFAIGVLLASLLWTASRFRALVEA
jgi:hypothetical protein